MTQIYAKDSIETKLSEIGLSENCNPYSVSGYTKGFTDIPDFGLIDIFNYLTFKNADYDRKKKNLKAFKTFEDLFSDGHVQQLEFNPLSKDDNACLFHAKVKPTQRESTYLKKEFYDSWFALDKSVGYGITGHCECKGGADGACRHIAAAFYELEAFDKVSCTEGENLWMKRPTCHDIPLPMTSLSVVKPTFGMINQDEKVLPNINDYDLSLRS
ncbi:hypothetical protein KUTeg_016652 [Tegillarca granosa]|uniref:SWIM-type domain-containing protein n=1 Tax=Tegillarca granosa TaxID=220873 RepID=A0ABQ9EQA4_TEGGR|nr:hypothetical protein KUTeg_016652 [Tegillarca granosa]